MSDPSDTQPSARWPVALMLLVVAAAWLPLYVQRRRAHLPNVDDYLYTLVSLRLAHAGSFTNLVHDFLHTGQTAPLMPLLSAPGSVHGVDGAVAAELPVLLLLAGGAWLLARRWVGPWEAALIGFAAAANQAVLGWSLMVHFSVAASALCLWSLASYLWSDGLQRWPWSLSTGLCVGLLLLSRSLAPAYVATMVIVMLIDVISRRRLSWAQAGLATVIAVAVAGPWWLKSGGTALHYLRSAGYEPSSGFTKSGAHLSFHSLVTRVRWTLTELGILQSLILVAAPLTAVVHRRRMPGAAVVAGWLGLTLLVLATSSNVGTGFGVPLVAVAITLGGGLVLARPFVATREFDPPEAQVHSDAAQTPTRSEVGQPANSWRRRIVLLAGILLGTALTLVVLVRAVDANAGADLGWATATIAIITVGALMTFRSFAVAAIVTVVAVGFAAEWSGGATSQWWRGTPYRIMALQATNDTPAPNIDTIHRQVARAISGKPTLLVRDDDLLNGNGLVYTASTEHLQQSLVSAPYADSGAGVRKLADAQLLIAGSTPAPYHHYINVVEEAAARAGWTKIRSWALACGNTVDLWSKSTGRAELAAKRRSARSPYEVAVLDDSPEAYWRLDDNSCNAADASNHGHTGAYLGKPELGAGSLIAGVDKSVHLDGKDDHVAFLSITGSSPMKTISFEAWVRPNRVPTSQWGAWQIISKWNTALLVLRGGKQPKFVFALYDSARSTYGPRVIGKTAIRPDRTYYVVGTYDGSRIRLYMNGVLESSVSYKGRLGDSPYGGDIAAAGWGPLPNPRFRGTLDEVAIYGRALTPRQIALHYRSGRRTGRHD